MWLVPHVRSSSTTALACFTTLVLSWRPLAPSCGGRFPGSAPIGSGLARVSCGRHEGSSGWLASLLTHSGDDLLDVVAAGGLVDAELELTHDRQQVVEDVS